MTTWCIVQLIWTSIHYNLMSFAASIKGLNYKVFFAKFMSLDGTCGIESLLNFFSMPCTCLYTVESLDSIPIQTIYIGSEKIMALRVTKFCYRWAKFAALPLIPRTVFDALSSFDMVHSEATAPALQQNSFGKKKVPVGCLSKFYRFLTVSWYLGRYEGPEFPW